jgi:transposase
MKRSLFYFFALIDFANGVYVGCGVPWIFEWNVFNKAVAMLKGELE